MGKASKSASSGGGVRQRKKKKNQSSSSLSSSSSTTSAAANNSSNQQATKDNKDEEPSNKNNKRRTKTAKDVIFEVEDDDDDDDEPAWHIIRRHPAFLGIIFLGIPYMLKILMLLLILQHPNYLKWFNPNIRSSLLMNETRQLLIVGSMSSGTTQTSIDLSQSILKKIEIGHEDTDTEWKFVRDGTVSWFHSIRFMKRSQNDINNLCLISWEFYSKDKMNFLQPWSNYGWGPSLFGQQYYDKYHFDPINFKQSYIKSCKSTLSNEFGCGLVSLSESVSSDDDDFDGKSTTTKCKTPFQYTLIQTRQPWKIVTSLVSKYCYDSGSKNKSNNKFHLPPKSLIKFLKALFPENDDDEEENIWSMTPLLDSSNIDDENLRICTNQMATYVYRLYTELLDNTQQPNDNDNDNITDDDNTNTTNIVAVQMYPIETTTICDVLKMGGLLNISTTIYKPNYDVVTRFCQTNSTQLFGNNSNRFNRGRLEVSQIITIADQSIQIKLLNLHKRMGYTNHPMF